MIDKKQPDIEAMLKEVDLYDNPTTEKQRDILRAAEKLFAESGFETATAAIAKEAKVTEKTLFKHFPTKAQLVNRILFPLLMRAMMPGQIRQMRSILSDDYASYQDFFARMSVDRWTTLYDLGPRLKLVISSLLANDKLREKIGEIWRENLWVDVVDGIRRFQDKGEIRKDIDPETLARLQIIIIAGHGLVHGMLARQLPFDREKSARLLAKIVFEGMAPRPSSER